MFKLLSLAGVATALVAPIAAADATSLLFTIGGSDRFVLDSDPTPSTASFPFASGGGFGISNVTFTHASGQTEVADVYFYSQGANPFGEDIAFQFHQDPSSPFPSPAIGLVGDQIFKGSSAHPHFDVGTYGTFTHIVITPAPLSTPVPEPASWTMMILGLGAVGWAMRRRKIAISFA